MRYQHGYNKAKEEKKKRRMEYIQPPEPRPIMQPIQNVKFGTFRSEIGLFPVEKDLDYHVKEENIDNILDNVRDYIEHTVIFDEMTGRRRLVSELIIGVKE